MWVRALLKLLRAEFFSSWPQGVLSLLATTVAFLTAFGIVFKTSEFVAALTQDQPQFLSYVWVTFLSSTLFIATTMLLLQRLLRRHEEIAKLGSQRDRAMRLQHQMAEAVRVAAAGKEGELVKTCVDRVLGGELTEYLKARLGGSEFHCTIKRISGQREGGGYLLNDEFRDDGQNGTTRPRDTVEKAEENYIYGRFKRAGINDSKQIYIPEVAASNSGDALIERARQRGYRAILVFPLNLPDKSSGLDRLVGFVGIDSPTPHAFDGFFEFSGKGDSAASIAGVDGIYRPREELHLLYGLADAIATILMLIKCRPANGSNP
jgi:hypothetical protein